MHKRIKGVDSKGRRYHALEPEAYAWVHATLIESLVTGYKRFATPMRRNEIDELYAEWRDLGQVVGVRERDLPPTWAGFQRYVDEMVHDRLEHTEAVDEVLDALRRPMAPPVPVFRGRAWRATAIPISRAIQLSTVGMMPPELRRKLDLRWTRANAVELAAIGRLSKAAGPLLPKSLRCMGPGYLKWRREAFKRTELGGAEPRIAIAA
jgi:uncharacterized protein (DUF2236 family)